ncbi:hypothetical protein V9T40_012408 [Parthenolecanium corni]|uniref:Glutaredoxin 3 n=1 Tax=Parthenolecanium corni TaxID=536013 RepID=A0AAN9XZA9_9HEMI
MVSSVSGIESLSDDSSKEVTVVLFYETSSEECEHMNEILEILSPRREFRNINFKKCSIKDGRDVFVKFNVNEVPSFLFIKNGNEIDRLVGADPASLNSKLRKYVKQLSNDDNVTYDLRSNSIVACVDESGDAQLNKDLINILNNTKVKYHTIDVASDNAVKEKLISFSGSSSFPQLYIKGDFIGDLNTVKKYKASGELSVWVEAAAKNLDERRVQRLSSLINQADIMVFMKGDRNTPRCGFSRQLMEILKETNLPFDTFDILTDEDVRQSLKVYSNWPTYPQVYVKGELVGGLDIIKSLKEDGDLISTLQG